MTIDLEKFFPVKIIDAEEGFRPFDPLFRQEHVLILYFKIHVLLQRFDEEIRQFVQIGLHTRGTGNDQRHLCGIQQYGIRFVHDAVIVIPQKTLLPGFGQIMEQIIEAKTAVRCIQDIGGIQLLCLGVIGEYIGKIGVDDGKRKG